MTVWMSLCLIAMMLHFRLKSGNVRGLHMHTKLFVVQRGFPLMIWSVSGIGLKWVDLWPVYQNTTLCMNRIIARIDFHPKVIFRLTSKLPNCAGQLRNPRLQTNHWRRARFYAQRVVLIEKITYNVGMLHYQQIVAQFSFPGDCSLARN